jgi:riboflavin-specific deaminase-like protein
MFVFSNLATSLDGKIATADRSFFPLGTLADRKLMQVLRKKSDVVLFGASTLRTFQKPCTVTGPAAKGLKRQPANAVLSSTLEGISPDWPFFTRSGFKRILFVCPQAPAERIRLFEPSCEIIVLDKPNANASAASQALAELKARGYKRVLVEGGGNVMWDFARDNLIDEYYVTLTPRILGGTEAPTLVDGAGFAPRDSLNLKLKSCRKRGNELYLVYKKTARRG